jgi:hypothetical protein
MSMLFLNFLEVVPGSALVSASAIFSVRPWDVFVIYLLCVAKMSDVMSAPVDVLAFGAVGEVLLSCNRRLVVTH